MPFQDISLVLLFISSVSLVVIVGLVVFIGVVVIRLLGLFSEVNTASQAMRRDINKLLHKASSLTEAERRALTHYDAGDEF
jgi:ABC-type protease/lipase transport system fused ATPase/permease subunit